MVAMITPLLLSLCFNLCSSYSVPRNGCGSLDYICHGIEPCIFRNALVPCNNGCPQEICLWNQDEDVELGKRSLPERIKKLPTKEKELRKQPEQEVSDTYLHLHLSPKQPELNKDTLEALANNITHFFSWPDKSIKNCQLSEEHLTCAVTGLNPVIVSTNLALEKNIDKITPILVDSVGTSNKNASVLAAEDAAGTTTVLSDKMTLSDVMIWVFGAILLLLLISLFLVYLVQRSKQGGHKTLSNESDPGSNTEFYYDYENLVRNRIQEQGSSTGHRPPNLTQHQISASSKTWNSEEGKGSPEYSGQSMDIQSAHLALSYMEQYHTNCEKIEREWEALCLYDAELNKSEVGKRSENVAKNRFSSVMPYDHNRVKLSNLHASDYINASYIYTESPKNPTYIASQGPLQNCAGDFWQMVWEQGISEIIMLSLNDNVDCYQYWGSDGNGVYYHYQLHLVSEHANHPDYPEYTVRSFYLKNLQTYETRTVTQFHYVAWNMSSSTPRSTQSLLDFRRKVHKSYRGLSAPLLVHCNDGIGRTGTFILLDMTLNRICKGVKEVDMEAAVEHLRDQRAGMVVTKEQYAFGLSAVVEEIYNILGEMPSPKTNPIATSPILD